MADSTLHDDLDDFFESPDASRAQTAPAPAGRPSDDLAAFFASPDAPAAPAAAPAAAAPAARPAARRSAGSLPSDGGDLASFFHSPDSPARPGTSGGDGASGRPSLRRAAPPSSRPAAPPRPTGPLAARRRRTGRILASFLGLVAFGIVGTAATVAWLSRDLPSLEQIENPRNLLATRVFTADDIEMARYYDGENRTWVGLADMAESVPKALIATEDRRFYDHWGMDLRGFAAVAWQAAQGGSLRGASTITMQLARNLYTSVGRERSIVRKAKEILTAIRIERTYTKDEILEAYLNTVPFLYNAYGIEAASQTYFGKHAADLTTPESATLVGMLAANTAYDPVRNPAASRERRNVVLANMRRSGDLSEADYAAARESPIGVEAFSVYDHANNLAPHFSEVLRLWFKEWCADNGYDPYKDGLVIRTTIDSRMQALATQAVQSQGDRIQQAVGSYQGWWSRNTAIVDEYIALTDRYTDTAGAPWRGGRAPRDQGVIAELRRDAAFMDSLRVARTRLEAGLVAIDPVSGQVKAWVGGRSFAQNKFDHVGQARRQPGSTFKLFAYTTAFNNGYSMQSTALDAPFSWGDWRPQNSGGGYAGTVTLASALAASRNVVAARITKHFGTSEVARTAYQMGIRSPLELSPPPDATAAERRAWTAKCRPFTAASNDCYARSIALGTADVNLLELAVGYATIADYGVYHGPTLEEERPEDPSIPPHIVLAVARIEDRYGNVIEDFTPVAREVLNASTAYTMFDAMRGVIRSGTGRGLGGFAGVTRLDLAGKTGTTQENADGWFMVMSRGLVAGSWTGFDDRRIKYPSTAIGQGGRTGLLVVGEFLRLLQADSTGLALDPEATFDKPAGYQPPTRAGRIGGSGGTLPYSRTRGERGTARPRSGGSRAGSTGAREMIDQFRNRDRSGGGGGTPRPAAPPAAPRPQTEGGGSGGRIGW
ncbi:MAG TPA: transglycosylase domain-containing protein [Rubricoccaceae bacterium]|jgi:penicillin-binding protein 1A